MALVEGAVSEAWEHVLEGTGCWCGPDLYRLCWACDGDDPGCSECEGKGIVPIDAIVPGDWGIVVHRLIPEDVTFSTE
jgi:hypothetical protein